MDLDPANLDRTTKDLLLYLDAEAVASTADLKEVMDVSSTKQIKYRAREYLIPAGLVREEKQGTDEHGRHLPLRYIITDRGEEYVDLYGDSLRDTSGDSLDDRVRRLERLTNRLREELVQMKHGPQGGDDRE
jgi:hypothetical protein